MGETETKLVLDDGAVGRGTVRGIGVREYRQPALRESGERGCAMCVDWTRAVQREERPREREPRAESLGESSLISALSLARGSLTALLKLFSKPLSIYLWYTARSTAAPRPAQCATQTEATLVKF